MSLVNLDYLEKIMKVSFDFGLSRATGRHFVRRVRLWNINQSFTNIRYDHNFYILLLEMKFTFG